MRFEAGGDWVYCDLDGSENGVSADQLGVIDVGGEIEPEITYCQLQPQSPVTTEPGEATDPLRALVYAEGLTPGAGQGSLIEGEVGWGAMAGDYESFTYEPLSYQGDVDGVSPGDLSNDEYGAPVTVAQAGDYRYVARFRVTEPQGEWFYCDLDGHSPDDDFEVDQIGELVVEEPPAPAITFCQTETPAITVAPDEATPQIQGLVYAAGITNMTGQGMGVTAELVWGLASEAPTDWANTESVTYVEDVDGLMPGDLANDRYGASVTITDEGEYGYAYRFSLDGGATWSWCDADGSDGTQAGFEADKVGSLTVSASPGQEITYCQTETATAQTTVGQPTGGITGQVYAAGITDMAGAGMDVTAELVWGDDPSDPTTWTDSVAATYLEEVGNNDRFEATITPAMEGDYDYAYRFSLDGGATWSWCDTDGSDGTQAGFETDKVGSLSVALTNEPDDCNLQFPVIANEVIVNDTVTVYGRIEEIGVTDVSDGDPSIAAQLWVGPVSADPITEPMMFDKIDATLNAAPTGLPATQDEFEANWTPTMAGSYKLVYFFSVDGGTTYEACDLDGRAAGGFEPLKVGVAVVHDTAPDLLNYCHSFDTGVTSALSNPMDPLFTAEVYEMGLTDVGNDSNSGQIEVEIGLGAPWTNPALMGAFTWRAAPFLMVNGNNYEYQAVPYDPGAAQIGSYHVVFRMREVGQADAEWVYCDNNDTSMDYLPQSASTLEITQ